MGTFRLQLFTAPGTRPVAVATQGPAEGGRLADWAGDYGAEVWRRHFPGSAEPRSGSRCSCPRAAVRERPQRFSLVTFRVWGTVRAVLAVAIHDDRRGRRGPGRRTSRL
jgi:hypothetical protein